ncbi:hypothetical protein PENTCL1PPCAC_8051, partial [Pristionchus entomophagus]
LSSSLEYHSMKGMNRPFRCINSPSVLHSPLLPSVSFIANRESLVRWPLASQSCACRTLHDNMLMPSDAWYHISCPLFVLIPLNASYHRSESSSVTIGVL